MINPKFLTPEGLLEISNNSYLDSSVKVDKDIIEYYLIDTHNIHANGSISSCGIADLDGIDDIWSFIDEYVKPIHKKTALKQILNHYKKGYAFLIISTAIYDKKQIKMLNEVCSTQSQVRTNPNSKNKIKIWIY